jgi:ABC-type multidrug transport system fused ATPase/permease subunit
MRDYMATAVSIKQRNLIRKLTFEEMPETTILLSSLDTLSAIQANRIIYFEDGEIVEEGDPRRLLGNPRSEFSRVVREIDPVLYKHIILGTIPEEEY